MLTLVINPGGTRRVVTIAEALYHLGVDVRRPSHCPERTPEERRRHKNEKNREYRRRMREHHQGREQ
ncbi:MAG: hypothetical protein ABFC89_11355 [Methanospirillum sp.]